PAGPWRSPEPGSAPSSGTAPRGGPPPLLLPVPSFSPFPVLPGRLGVSERGRVELLAQVLRKDPFQPVGRQPAWIERHWAHQRDERKLLNGRRDIVVERDERPRSRRHQNQAAALANGATELPGALWRDRKSTRLNSSHQIISYAVFCLKKKNEIQNTCS